MVVDYASGEGDSEHTYMHVHFNLVVRSDVTPASGWLSGQTLRAKESLENGEIVLLYRKTSSDRDWELVRYDLVQSPSRKNEGPVKAAP